MRKVVVSTTLTDPKWANTEVIAGDVIARVRDLKGEDGGHVVQYGFGDVSRLLLGHGLFDEFRLWIHPQLVGPSDAGDLLYRPGTTATLELTRLEGPGQRDHPGDLPALTLPRRSGARCGLQRGWAAPKMNHRVAPSAACQPSASRRPSSSSGSYIAFTTRYSDPSLRRRKCRSGEYSTT